MLLELIRQGDAYTSANGADDEDLSGWTQLGLLFNIEDNEPSAADAVPLCACGSMKGLHIAELADSKTATLLCDECRKTRRDRIDASVPIYLINTPADLDTLLVRNDLTPDESVITYRNLLNAILAAKWVGRVRSNVKAVQTGFFDNPETEQQSLL